MGSTVDRLVAERNVWMATVRPDGRPHLTPVWFVWVDARIWVATGAGSVKARNVSTNPSVSIALEGGDAPVVVEGEVTRHPHHRPAVVVSAFLDKYGWDITISDDPDVGTVVLWEIAPAAWLFARPDETG